MPDVAHLTVPQGTEVLDTCAELGLGAFLRAGGAGETSAGETEVSG
jgi:predicted methyltransferase